MGKPEADKKGGDVGGGRPPPISPAFFLPTYPTLRATYHLVPRPSPPDLLTPWKSFRKGACMLLLFRKILFNSFAMIWKRYNSLRDNKFIN